MSQAWPQDVQDELSKAMSLGRMAGLDCAAKLMMEQARDAFEYAQDDSAAAFRSASHKIKDVEIAERKEYDAKWQKKDHGRDGPN